MSDMISGTDNREDNGSFGEFSNFDISNTGELKCEYIPKNRYESLLYRLYKNNTYYEMMKIASYAIVAFTVYVYFSTIVTTLWMSGIIELAKLVLITAVPFLGVSVVRRIIGAPRPYELLEFYERAPKKKSGCSFPSRHVFSVFIIGTVLLAQNLPIGILLLSLGVLLAVFRVLLGIHFIRDVVAGAIAGALSGGIGILILHLI
jgi:membrane-associated phospholipid phosphatase